MDKFNYYNFTEGDVSLDVRVSVEDGTIWLSAKEMAILFSVDVSTIRRIIKSTYNVDASVKVTVSAKNAHFASMVIELPKKKPFVAYDFEVIKNVGTKLKNNIYERIESHIQKSHTSKENRNIIIFNNGYLALDVNVDPEEETVWLTQEQIATLYETTRPNVSMHIKNILNEGELELSSISKDFLHVAPNLREYKTTLFNLDLVLAVGYRVKGKRAIEFRKWVSSVLKRYLLNGYATDDVRIRSSERNIERLENELDMLKADVDKLKKDTVDYPAKEKLFFAGQFFDAYSFLSDLMKMSKENVTVVDPYFDLDALSILSKCNRSIEKKVFLSNKAILSEADVKNFVRQYGNISLNRINSYHDRFIIIDNKDCYAIGTSLNHAGRLTFYITKINSLEIVETIITNINKKKKPYQFKC